MSDRYEPLHARPPTAAWRVLIAGGLIAGLALRIWILRSPMRVLDGDEAVAGLMARAAGDGRFTSFYWGQAYGGSLETLLAAPIVELIPTTVIGLKAVPLMLNAIAAVLVWRIGRWVFDRRAAALAAVVFWMWPAPYLWWATKERGFYQALLVCGLVVILTALRLSARPGSVRDWLVFGFSGGLGWWQSPQIVYFAAPAVVWLAVTLWRHGHKARLANATWSAMGAVIGAAPWIAFNVRNPLLSLRSDFAEQQGSYLDHLHTFFTEGLAMVAGARVIYENRWLNGGLGMVGFAAVMVLVALGLLRAIRPRRRAFLIAASALAFPFILAIFPNSFYVGEGRYLLFLGPFVALAIGASASRHLALTAVALGLLGALTVGGLYAQRTITSPFAGGRRVPVEMGPLVAALDASGHRAVWTDYWIAYRLRYHSNDRIAAGVASGGPVRDVRGQRRADAAEAPVWVFVAGSSDIDRFTCTLERARISHTRLAPRGFVVIEPAQTVRPGQLDGCST